MPNEYTNLTQGYDALLFSTQQTGYDKNDAQFADYDGKESQNLYDRAYRRSSMNQSNKKVNLSGTRNRELN